LLTAAPSSWTENDAGCINPMSGWPYYRQIEAAGAAHLELVTLRSQGIYHTVVEETISTGTSTPDRSQTSSADAPQLTAEEKAKMAQKKRQKKASEAKETDYYELLGLGHLRWAATEKDIKKAYRKMILSHHPDKQAQASSEVDDEVFKSISEAYDCLSNLEKRRGYDSKDEFDDAIPTEAHAQKGDFFRTFGPVFELNKKWSIDADVPSLGDDSNDHDSVLRFYDFWRSFKSWREFSAGEEEFDLEDAECREEKRWMERQNKKMVKQMKKNEHARIMNLVNLAEKYDPRMIAWKKAQEEERIRKKEERKAAKIARREERDRAEREERERIVAEEKAKAEQAENAKKQQVAENKQIRKKRPQLRKICRQLRATHEENPKQNTFNPREEHVELLCKMMNLKQFLDLIKAFGTDQGPHAFRDMLIVYKIIPEDEPYFEAPAQPEEPEESEPEKESEPEEESEPDKEPEKKDNAWTTEEITLLTKGLTKYPVGTRNRYQLVAELVGTRTVKEIIEQTKIGASETAQEQTITKKDAFERFKETKKEAKVVKEVAPTIVAPVVPVEEVKSVSNEPEEWSPEEQKLLEAAMKKFTAKEGDRWNKIAGELPGRSKQDCIARYKYLVEFFKRQKKKQTA